MDKFKKYLQDHNDELNIDSPSEKLLQRIQLTAMPKKQMPVVKLVLRFAAAACLLIAVGAGIKFLFYTDKKPRPDEIVKQNVIVNDSPDSFQHEIKNDTANQNIAMVTEPVQSENKVTGTKKTAHDNIDPEKLMRSFENNYTQLVNLQLNNLRSTPVYAETQGYFTEFKSSLKQMDADEAGVRMNIKANGLNEQLLEQLINIYQEKLNVLKSLQAEIKKINDRVKQNQLPTDSLTNHFINI